MKVIYQDKPKNKTITVDKLVMGKAYKCVKIPNNRANISYFLDKILIAVSYQDTFGVWLNTEDRGVLAKLTDSYSQFEFEEFNCDLVERTE